MGQTDENYTADVGRNPGSCLISSHMNYQNEALSSGNLTRMEIFWNSATTVAFCYEEGLKLKFPGAKHGFIW